MHNGDTEILYVNAWAWERSWGRAQHHKGEHDMRRCITALILGSLLFLSIGAVTSAEPSNYPENTNACVGTSSTTANTQFQEADPDKLRSDQARQDDGQPGRADSVSVIPQCVAAGLERGHVAD
jgi:hypothetical protein